MEIQKLTEEEIKLVELWKKIPDIGNEPPMFHVTENQVDFPTLLRLVAAAHYIGYNLFLQKLMGMIMLYLTQPLTVEQKAYLKQLLAPYGQIILLYAIKLNVDYNKTLQKNKANISRASAELDYVIIHTDLSTERYERSKNEIYYRDSGRKIRGSADPENRKMGTGWTYKYFVRQQSLVIQQFSLKGELIGESNIPLPAAAERPDGATMVGDYDVYVDPTLQKYIISKYERDYTNNIKYYNVYMGDVGQAPLYTKIRVASAYTSIFKSPTSESALTVVYGDKKDNYHIVSRINNQLIVSTIHMEKVYFKLSYTGQTIAFISREVTDKRVITIYNNSGQLINIITVPKNTGTFALTDDYLLSLNNVGIGPTEDKQLVLEVWPINFISKKPLYAMTLNSMLTEFSYLWNTDVNVIPGINNSFLYTFGHTYGEYKPKKYIAMIKIKLDQYDTIHELYNQLNM